MTHNAELGRAVYRNYCEMWRNVGACAGDSDVFKVEERATMLLVRSRNVERVPHMVLNPIIMHGNERAWTEALIQEWAGNPVSLMIGIAPGDERSPFVSALQRAGFIRGIRPSVAMARLATSGFEIRDDPAISLAESNCDLEEARVLLARVFGLPSEIFAFYTPAACVKTYVLREGGQAIAAACLCPFAGVAGIYSVGVLSDKRGSGYAQRLVLQVLSEAAGMGLNTAVLSCERGLVPLYRRMGFGVCWELMTYWMEAWWR